MTQTASVIGLGKLGAPMAAAMAARGLTVIGVDADGQKVEAINRGQAHIFEPGLQQMLDVSAGRLKATQSIAEAVEGTEITFLVVATPSEESGGFSLRYVLPACEAIGRALRSKPGFHLVVLTSTVMPGTTGGPVREALERASAKKVGRDFGLCYGPEFIALGSVIRDFLNPDFLLIGESDPIAGAKLETLYRTVCENRPAIARMNAVNAEITKLAVNTYVTTKISFANMIARICEQIPTADGDVVTKALGLDSRIGGKYLKGAVSYGGPCFPRDNRAMTALAEQLGASADISQVTDRFNRVQVSWLANLVERLGGSAETVGILGLTYKPNTDVIEEAAGLLLARELSTRGTSVVVFDPAGQENARKLLGETVRFAVSAEECIDMSGVTVVATPWAEFLAIPTDRWARSISPRAVIDCWRAFGRLADVAGVHYFALGTGIVREAVREDAQREILRSASNSTM